MRLFNMLSTAALFGAVFGLGAAQTASANVADNLNANYNNIVHDCGGADKPGYLCSGNLFRFTSYSANGDYHTWDASPTAIQKKGVSFTYLRHDIKTNLVLYQKTYGVIYYPDMLKPSDKGVSETLCVFPGDSWSDFRSYDACGAMTFYPQSSMPCQDQGIYTADAWYQSANFTNDSLNGDSVGLQRQCGFDVSSNAKNTAEIFNENLKAIDMIYGLNIDKAKRNQYNEVINKPWPLNEKKETIDGEKLPIQAFFYMEKNGVSGLSIAQVFQRDYYKEKNVFTPVIKLNNDDPANIKFSYNAEDQGITVADQLNANYNRIVDNCGSKNSPSYQCSGVMFRIVSNPGSNYHVWDPSAKSIQQDGVSFAYLRKDIHIKNFINSGRNSGFIYYPTQQTPDNVQAAKVSCAFPAVGDSDSRNYGRCSESAAFPLVSVECQQQGIITADQWYTHFSSITAGGLAKFQHQCGFDVSNSGSNIATAFSEFIKAHNMIYNIDQNVSQYGSNEVIIKTSPVAENGKTIFPSQIPLQAFFYVNDIGLTEAQSYQQDYYNTTGKIVPVVYMNVSDLNNISFEYKTTDQVDLKKKLLNN